MSPTLMWISPCLQPSRGNHLSIEPSLLMLSRSRLSLPSSSSLPAVSSSNSSIRSFWPSASSTTASKYSFHTGFRSLSIVRVLKNCEPTAINCLNNSGEFIGRKTVKKHKDTEPGTTEDNIYDVRNQCEYWQSLKVKTIIKDRYPQKKVTYLWENAVKCDHWIISRVVTDLEDSFSNTTAICKNKIWW